MGHFSLCSWYSDDIIVTPLVVAIAFLPINLLITINSHESDTIRVQQHGERTSHSIWLFA